VSESLTKPTDDALRLQTEIPALDLIKSLEESVAKIMAGGPPAMAGVAADAEALGLSREYQALKALVSAVKARKLFEEIEGEIGSELARQLFGELAASGVQRQKRTAEEYNNMLLLGLYIKAKWPVQRLARKLAELNRTFPGKFKFGGRGYGSDAAAIEKQLSRLLRKNPAEEASIIMRMFLTDARKAHKELGVKQGRPSRDK
jgi:hypothetical protein